MSLSGATSPGQNEPGRYGYKTVLRIPDISSITEATPSDCSVTYPGHSLGESYLSAGISVGVFYIPKEIRVYWW